MDGESTLEAARPYLGRRMPMTCHKCGRRVCVAVLQDNFGTLELHVTYAGREFWRPWAEVEDAREWPASDLPPDSTDRRWRLKCHRKCGPKGSRTDYLFRPESVIGPLLRTFRAGAKSFVLGAPEWTSKPPTSTPTPPSREW